MEIFISSFVISTILGWLDYKNFEIRNFYSIFKSKAGKQRKLLKLFSRFNKRNNKKLNIRNLYLSFIIITQLLLSSSFIYFVYIEKTYTDELSKAQLVKYYFNHIRHLSDLIVYNGLMLYGIKNSKNLSTLLLKYVEISKCGLTKSKSSKQFFILFLIMCLALIPFEVLIISLASSSLSFISTQYQFDLVGFLKSYTLKYLIILESFGYCILFHMLVTTESEKIIPIHESIMKFIIKKDNKNSFNARKKQIVFSNALKTLKELKYYHIILTKYFGFPLFAVLFFGIICTITEFFYLTFVANLTFLAIIWSFLTIIHSVSFFIPLVAAPTIALYQVRFINI